MKFRMLIIPAAACLILMAISMTIKDSDSSYDRTKQELLLRKLAHELMLSSGDSISRVLPVKQISAQEFQVFPEAPLAIVPDSFMSIVNRAVKAGNFTGSFTANIVKYPQKETVYGFALSPVEKDNIVSCLGTKLPKDRYYLNFVFAPAGNNGFTMALYFLTGILLIAGILFATKRKNKKSIPLTEASLEDPSPEPGPGCIALGNYIFNPGQQFLQLNGQKTILTVKESQLLQILANAPNIMVEREDLQREVWENEGVIVTRSLDMFISKLRKKLSDDPAIKIVNVHGKGYRLQVSDTRSAQPS